MHITSFLRKNTLQLNGKVIDDSTENVPGITMAIRITRNVRVGISAQKEPESEK